MVMEPPTETLEQIEARLLAKHDEKRSISLAEARAWMVSLPPEEFEIVFNGISTRIK